jgi:TonB-linked SusC/RagA family outer membrane protein
MTIKRLLKRMTFLILCVSFTQLALSQTKVITGKITDDKGAPVQGASVSVKGSKGGTTTDANGGFSLTVGAAVKSLIVSSVGYNQQEIAVTDQTSVSVALVTSSQSLNDVVVIGYGSAQRKDITGAVASVKAKDFNRGVVAPEELLIGKVAGLQVSNNNGQPGGSTITKIRGNNSIVSGNNPLYVIDGVSIDATSPLPPNNITGIGTSVGNNPLLFLNPGDIAQIDILKDASAAAIYGARGENGVILITLNKGGSKTNIEAGASVGTYAGLMKAPDILTASQYVSELAVYGQHSDSGLRYDPFNTILQNKATSNYFVALSGGSDNGKFRASFSASNKPGIIVKSGLAQYNASFTGEHTYLDKRLKLNFEFIASNYTLQSAPISTNAGSTGNLISAAMNWNPTLRLVNPDGTYNQTNPSGQINPSALSAYTDDYSHVTQLFGLGGVAFTIIPGLVYNFLYGISYATSTRDAQLQGLIAATGSNFDGKGAGQISDATLSTQTITNTLSYTKQLNEKFNLRVLGGYEFYETSNLNYNLTSVYAFNFNVPGGPSYPNIAYYNDMQAGNQANLRVTSSAPPATTLQSYFARAEINYDNKYFLTGTFRADGSSKFGANNKYGYFPSVGARWNVLNEDFMKTNKTFNTLALRIGWGQVGGQDGLIAGASKSIATVSGFNGSSNAAPPTSIINFASPNLKWETLTSTDGGIDFGFLGNRLVGYVDFFLKKTTSPIFPGTLPVPSIGATIWQNLPGYITNKGFELSLTGIIVSSKDFTWTVNGNMEYVRNKFIYSTLGTSPLFLTGGINGQGVSSAFAQAIANNQPIDVFYLRTFTGFDKAGIATVASQASSYVGDPNPHYVVGFGMDFSYKKWSLSMNSHGTFGNQIFNNTLLSVTNLGNISNGKNIAQTLIGTQESLANPVSASTRFLYSGSYMKLGNATIAYNLGGVGNIIKSSRIYVTGYNLFEITKYPGFDAEVNQDHNNSGIPSLGMDYIGYPTPRSVTVGVTFSLN